LARGLRLAERHDLTEPSFRRSAAAWRAHGRKGENDGAASVSLPGRGALSRIERLVDTRVWVTWLVGLGRSALTDSSERSFFERVYIVVRMIPRGKVASYGQIATYLGHPRAARTVGWALHGIPQGSDVPWQRVINAKGRITISGAEYSASLQRELLEEEGIVFGPDERVDMSVYRWDGPDWGELDRVMRGGRGHTA